MEIFHERDFHHILENENNSCDFEFIPDVFLYVYENITEKVSFKKHHHLPIFTRKEKEKLSPTFAID
jgi:hypothetical protein